MEKIDIVLWVLGVGFTFNFGLMLVIWQSLNKRMDKLDEKLSNRIDKLDEKVTDIDRRLCRMEGAFSMKECCVLHNQEMKKEAK